MHKKESAAISSIIVGLALAVAKFIVGVLTGSLGIISEAAHSILDLGAAAMTYFAVKFGDRPADESHPFGYGKIESISALIETGLLFVTAVWIIYESVRHLFEKSVEIQATWYAFVVIALSVVVNIFRARSLNRIAKETSSQALEADALHFSSDVWSSAVVLLGLVFVAFGIKGADAIAAMGVSVFVILAGYRLGKRTIDVLVDAAPKGISEEVKKIAEKLEGVVSIERVRARPLGPTVFIELVVNVSRRLSVSKAQEIVKNIEDNVKKNIPGADIAVYTKSVRLDNETIVEEVQALAIKNSFPVHNIVVDNMGDKKYISYDMELPDTLTIKDAHKVADSFELEIKKELGEDVEFNSQIEPAKNEAILSSNVTEKEMARVMKAINYADGKIDEITGVHNTLVRKIEGKFFVSLHCLAKTDVSLEDAHNATKKFEFLLREKMRGELKRVIVHIEPE